jgi:hypothetical protein
MHLTAFDSLCHQHGRDSAELEAAYQSLDRNLASLLEAAGDSRDVIVFSDHSQINVHTILDPNDILVTLGLLQRMGNYYCPGESGCYIECGGGSAFFHAGKLAPQDADNVREKITQSKGFRRFLTERELREAGYFGAAFGFCAQSGYCYKAFGSAHKAQHGYPLDMPDSNVFYMARGFGLEPGVSHGGSLLDIAPLVSRRLNLELNIRDERNVHKNAKGK